MPSLTALCLHTPLLGSQLSVVQGLLSSQLVAVPLHWAVLHASPWVHATPSSQVVPSLTAAVVHRPVAGLQPSWVQGLPSLQLAAIPLQLPCLHASLLVHSKPSLQDWPSATAG